MPELDKYQQQIEELMALSPNDFDKAVYDQWTDARGLFNLACRLPTSGDRWAPMGCLTMVKRGTWVAQTPELTLAIKNDPRLPTLVTGIRQDRKQLEAFREWQSKLDDLLGEGEET